MGALVGGARPGARPPGRPRRRLPLIGDARGLADHTGELQRMFPVAVACAEAAWLRGDSSAARAATDGTPSTSRPESGPPIGVGVELQAWRRRAGIDAGAARGQLGARMGSSCRGRPPRRPRMPGRSARCPYETALARPTSGRRHPPDGAPRSAHALGARPSPRGCPPSSALGARAIPRGPRHSTRANPAGSPPARARGSEPRGRGASERRDRRAPRRVPTRTVDHHVSSILRKLDARTRGEATAEAARLGLLEDR